MAESLRPLTVAPAASETERRIAEIWARILGVAEIGPRDNFFALGGHSLLAVQAHRDIRRDLAPTLGVTDIFRFPTLGALAAHIDGTGAPKTSPEQEAERGQAMSDLMARRRAMRGGRPAGGLRPVAGWPSGWSGAGPARRPPDDLPTEVPGFPRPRRRPGARWLRR